MSTLKPGRDDSYDRANQTLRRVESNLARHKLGNPGSPVFADQSPRRVREMADATSPSRSITGKVGFKPKAKAKAKAKAKPKSTPKAKASSNPLGIPSVGKRVSAPVQKKLSLADAAQGMFGAKTTGKRKPMKK